MTNKIDKFAIALTSIMVLILVFGITLTGGANNTRQQNDQTIAELKTEITELADRLAVIEKSDQQKSTKISKLIKKINNLNQQNNLLLPSSSLTSKISSDNREPKNQAPKSAPKKYYTTLEIAGVASYQIEYIKSQTALDQLISAAKNNHFEINYTDYDFGVFVDCLGGICGDSSHFWALYHNGQMSMVGASDLILEINDKISWVYTVIK